jgi:hypothetical protein
LSRRKPFDAQSAIALPTRETREDAARGATARGERRGHHATARDAAMRVASSDSGVDAFVLRGTASDGTELGPSHVFVSVRGREARAGVRVAA